MSERVDLSEFVGAFVVEAQELTAAASSTLLEIDAALSRGDSHPRGVRDVFRALHTVKGLAGMVGVEPIVEIAHALENLLRIADKAGGHLPHAAIEVTLRGVAAITERVGAVAEQLEPPAAPPELLAAIAALETTGPAAPTHAAAPSSWDARLSAGEREQLRRARETNKAIAALAFEPSDELAARGITIASVRAQLSAIGEIVKVVPQSVQREDGRSSIRFEVLFVGPTDAAVLDTIAVRLLEPVFQPASASAAGPATPMPTERPPALAPELEPEPAHAIGRSYVRVELSRLDELQQQLSQLIVTRFRFEHEVAAIAAAGHDARRWRELVDLQRRQLRDLRLAILRARLVRAAEVFEPLVLLVRSLGRSSGKDVRLALDVQDTELDKAVADRLLPALIHLVRNAVDHALEPAAERMAAGKPAVGTVRVRCHEVGGNRVELLVSDDGRGIDRAEVARRARRDIASDRDLLDVLTTPGFSTRQVASRTSGRGLGMDIVRRVVGELGGELTLETARGQGTTFTMRVAVTIAVIEVFSFVCGQQTFVAPASAIEEIFDIEPDALRTPPSTPRTARYVTLLERRDRAVPVISLSRALGLAAAAGGSADGTLAAPKALMIQRDGEPFAFSIDRMLGRQEVVVRPIEDPLVDVVGVSGTTDLGDGQPTLVLDLAELADVAHQQQRSSS